MKKFLTTVIFLLILLPVQKIRAETVPADNLSEENIEELIVDITINKDGTIDVKESIIYFFPDSRHGIYRNIPYLKTNQEGKKFKLKIDNYKITDEKGKKYQFSKSVEDGDVVLKIGDPNKTITGTHTYVLSYKVSGALSYFSDHDELYWNSVGSGWTVPIRESVTRVSLPASVNEQVFNTVCYVGIYGASQQDCDIKKYPDSGKAQFSTNKMLYVGEGMTVVIGFPKDMVSVLEPQPDRSGLIWSILGVILALAAVFWYLVFPFIVFFKWFKDYLLSKKARVVAAWFEPPEDKRGQKLAPAETSVLLDKSVDHKDLTATLIQLAQKGYLKIKQTDKKKFEIEIIAGKNDGNMQEFEKFLLDTIKEQAKTDNILKLSEVSGSVKFGKAIEDFYDKVSKELVKKGLFTNNPHDTYKTYSAIGYISIVMVNILLAISALLFGRKSALKTALGVEKFGEAKSLKNFLASQDVQLDYQAKNQMFFEKLLPYATAFGVEDIWVERFKDITMTAPAWFVGDNFTNASYAAFTQRMGSSARSSYSRATSSSSSRGFTSGFSGGSSGGGGGGGGGGSW